MLTRPPPDPSPERERRNWRIRPGLIALIALTILASCHKPTFDERFAKAEKQIRAREESIDKELADKASEAAAAGEAPATPTDAATTRP